jgi:hypothetical protein
VCIEGEEFGDGGVRYGLEVACLSREEGAQNGVLVVEGRLGCYIEECGADEAEESPRNWR